MKEINRSTLIEALSMLPEHDPPDHLWEVVETELDLLNVLPESEPVAQVLPEFEPPSDLWNKITTELDGGGKMIPIWKWSARVAAALVFILATWWLMNIEQAPLDEGVLSYSIEVLEPSLEEADWDEDEDAFQQFMTLCQTGNFVCEQPAFRNLKSELEELTEAKNDLKDAMGAYGASPELVQQMKQIELERTDLLKKMMVMLI